MELDFIDISKADEQERAHMPGAVQQSKSNKKFNKSIFLDISEDAGGDGLIYESEGVNRAVAGRQKQKYPKSGGKRRKKEKGYRHRTGEKSGAGKAQKSPEQQKSPE